MRHKIFEVNPAPGTSDHRGMPTGGEPAVETTMELTPEDVTPDAPGGSGDSAESKAAMKSVANLIGKHGAAIGSICGMDALAKLVAMVGDSAPKQESFRRSPAQQLTEEFAPLIPQERSTDDIARFARGLR